MGISPDAPEEAKKIFGNCYEFFYEDDEGIGHWDWGMVTKLAKASFTVTWVKGAPLTSKYSYDDFDQVCRLPGNRSVGDGDGDGKGWQSWKPQYPIQFCTQQQPKKKRKMRTKLKQEQPPLIPSSCPLNIFPFSAIATAIERMPIGSVWDTAPDEPLVPSDQKVNKAAIQGYHLLVVDNLDDVFSLDTNIAFTSCPPGLEYFTKFRKTCSQKFQKGSIPDATESVYNLP